MSMSRPGQGTRLRAGGNDITVKIHPDDGALDFSMFESTIPAGGHVSPHLHREFEEAFYLLEGALMFLLDRDWCEAEAGAAVHIRRGMVHAFRNESGAPARVLVVHSPAIAIRMIEEMAALPAGSDPSASAAVLVRHQSEPVRLELTTQTTPSGSTVAVKT